MTLTDRNVTIDPLSAATPVDHPEIAEVLNLVGGTILDAGEFIASHRYDALIAERMRIRESLRTERPLFACPLCSTPIYLVANMQKRFFFRHLVEDGSCPAQTRSTLTEDEIRARKYHGLRESEAHKRIKALIERSLRADPSFSATTILQEKHWRSAHDPSRWRQPDVQAVRGSQRFAFEAQLSTTFLSVVAERRLFYRAERALLIWVMQRFSPEYRRLTTDDLLFSNNSNVLVVNEETTQLSEQLGAFHLHCYYRRPLLEGDTLRDQWESKLVRFSELTCVIEDQSAYFFDWKGEEARLREASASAVRAEFFEFWKTVVVPRLDWRTENVARWNEIRDKLSSYDVPIPERPSGDGSFRAMIHGLLSAMQGEPVGWHFDTLVQVAHHLAIGHPEHLLSFGSALEVSGYKARLAQQDVTQKWARKRKAMWARIQARDPRYMSDERWLSALAFLFPDVGRRLEKFTRAAA